MKVCPLLQGGSNHPITCLGDLCEWWLNGCPAHPREKAPVPQTVINYSASPSKPPKGEPKRGTKGL
jgi:hypothetical protein